MNRRGIAATEFALVAGALFLIVGGVADIGTAIQQRMMLQQALRAGGQYAFSFPTNTAGIVGEMQQALPAAWTDSISNATACDCANNCSTACPNGPGGYTVLSLCRNVGSMFFLNGATPCGPHGVRATLVLRYE